VRFRFIEEHSASFSTNRLCRVLDVSPRGLRAFHSLPASRRQRSDLVTLVHIKEQSRLSLGSYDRSCMTEELKEIGLDIVHRRVGWFPLIDCFAINFRSVDAQEFYIHTENM
jgi:putative transposase